MEPLRPGDPRGVGAYRLLARLGAGRTGPVYLGRSRGGLLVAVRVLHPRLLEDPGFRARLRREVGAARAVGGAFVASVVDADAEARTPWLATEFLPGLSLRDVVERDGPLPTRAVLVLGAGLAGALTSIHRAGVVHHDLKPSNVIVGRDGPRVVDFGIAAGRDVSASAGFMAPEQARGEVTTGPAADVFSLAAILVYAATGQGPHGDGPPHVLLRRAVHERPRLDAVTDPELRDLVGACLVRDPGLRPSPARILDRLAPYAGELRGTHWLPGHVAGRVTHAHAQAHAETLEYEQAPARTGRRKVLVLGTVGVVVAAGAAATGAAQLWPEPDLQAGIGAAPSPPRGAGSAKVLWKRASGKVDPVVAGGVVYAVNARGVLLAFDAGSGRVRWRYDAGARSPEAPAVAGGVVYISDVSGTVHAVDASSGRLRWWREIDGNASQVVASGGVVYVGDAALYALDAADGSVRWRVPRKSDHLTVADGVVYASAHAGVTAYDAATGRPRWTSTTMHGTGGVAVAEGVAYRAQGDRGIVAVDARTGARRWRVSVGARVRKRPLVESGVVYVGDSDRTLYALDATTGAMRWQVQCGRVNGTPVVGNGTLFVTAGGQLHAIEPATGRVIWTFTEGGRIRSAPAVANGIVYVSGKDGNLYALDANRHTAWPSTDVPPTAVSVTAGFSRSP